MCVELCRQSVVHLADDNTVWPTIFLIVFEDSVKMKINIPADKLCILKDSIISFMDRKMLL